MIARIDAGQSPKSLTVASIIFLVIQVATTILAVASASGPVSSLRLEGNSGEAAAWVLLGMVVPVGILITSGVLLLLGRPFGSLISSIAGSGIGFAVWIAWLVFGLSGL